jgi:endoglycosylceramidase
VNVVYKAPPYLPITNHFDSELSFSQEDMENLEEWGLNAIRLGVQWPGVEPQQGVYDETYLQKAKQIVDDAAKHNIYTLVDFHQDLLSEKFCGDGIPLWAVKTQKAW